MRNSFFVSRFVPAGALFLAVAAFSPASYAQLVPVDSFGSPIMAWNNNTSIANDNGDPNEYNYSNNGYNGGQIRSNPSDNGSSSNLTDASLTSYDVSEYDGDLPAPLNPPDYAHAFDSVSVGLTGGTLSTISAVTPITQIQLIFALDSYGGTHGGLFGDNGDTDFINNAGAYTLQLPTLLPIAVQVTLDGTNWTSVGFTTNYYDVLNGMSLGDGATTIYTAPITFTLDNPTDGQGIDGIRVIGNRGRRPRRWPWLSGR